MYRYNVIYRLLKIYFLLSTNDVVLYNCISERKDCHAEPVERVTVRRQTLPPFDKAQGDSPLTPVWRHL